MLSDTLTITDNGNSVVLVRVNQDAYASEYRFRDTLKEYRIRVRHTKTKANGSTPGNDRHNVELVKTVYATPSTSESVSKVYFVIEQQPMNISVDLAEALFGLATESSSALLDSLMQWES